MKMCDDDLGDNDSTNELVRMMMVVMIIILIVIIIVIMSLQLIEGDK